jgi:hypothetical protein
MIKRLALLALAASLTAGCASEDTASVQPFAICAMPDTCSFADECGAQYLGPLTFDPTQSTEMLVAIEMHNQLPNNEGPPGSGQVNTHDAHLESYTVVYGGSGILTTGGADIPARTSTAQQTIAAGSASVVVIIPFQNDILSAFENVPLDPDYETVNLTVTLKGRFEDGGSWEAPFRFPVRICDGCIAISCDDPLATPVSACPSLAQEPHGKVTCL